jgi:hypothetical protein
MVAIAQTPDQIWISWINILQVVRWNIFGVLDGQWLILLKVYGYLVDRQKTMTLEVIDARTRQLLVRAPWRAGADTPDHQEGLTNLHHRCFGRTLACTRHELLARARQLGVVHTCCRRKLPEPAAIRGDEVDVS